MAKWLVAGVLLAVLGLVSVMAISAAWFVQDAMASARQLAGDVEGKLNQGFAGYGFEQSSAAHGDKPQ